MSDTHRMCPRGLAGALLVIVLTGAVLMLCDRVFGERGIIAAIAMLVGVLAFVASRDVGVTADVRGAEGGLGRLVASLDALVWEADARPFRITYAAQRADVIVGHPLERWRHDPEFRDREVVHPDDRDRVVAARAAALADGGGWDGEYRAIGADGTVHWLREIVHATRDRSGVARSLSGIIVDVSRRNFAEQRLVVQHAVTAVLAEAATLELAAPRLLEAICTHLEWTWAALWMVDGDALRLVAAWATPTIDAAGFEAASRAVAFPREVGLPGRVWASGAPAWIADVVADDNFPRAAAAAAAGLHGAFGFPLLTGGAVVGVLELFTSTRRAPDASLDGMLANLGAPVGQFLERARGDAARLAALRREHAARVEAEQASRTKDEFLATVSHELRAPLTPILLWARMLRGGMLDDATTSRALDVIETNAKGQAQLVDDLLEMSRIVTGKIRLEVAPTVLGPVVEQAVASMRAAADAKGVTMTTSIGNDGVVVSGDPDRLQQIVWKLVANAVKFTPTGGRVDVTVARAVDAVEIAVQDTGQGIPPEFLPYVFEPFRQADGASTRAFGGLGLGLAIVRHLVELHGGTVHVESGGEGAGSRFMVRLPVRGAVGAPPPSIVAASSGAATTDEAASGVPRPEHSLTGRRVLLVEDDDDTQQALRAVLERAGAEVRTAGSAAHALDVVTAFRPDVLVSDVGLPGEDGYALLGRIRALPEADGRDVPAIALTGYGGDEDRARATAAGFARHMVKPIDPPELVDVVAALAAGRLEQRDVPPLDASATRAAPPATADPVAERARALAALDEEAVREAMRFVSHELRQPLAALRIWLNLLEAEAGESLSAEARDHLAQIRASVTWMAELISGGLTESRL